MASSGHGGTREQGPDRGFLAEKVGNPYGNKVVPFGGEQESLGLDSELDNKAPGIPNMTLFKGHSGRFPRSDRGQWPGSQGPPGALDGLVPSSRAPGALEALSNPDLVAIQHLPRIAPARS